jgi:hypothetical protein
LKTTRSSGIVSGMEITIALDSYSDLLEKHQLTGSYTSSTTQTKRGSLQQSSNTLTVISIQTPNKKARYNIDPFMAKQVNIRPNSIVIVDPVYDPQINNVYLFKNGPCVEFRVLKKYDSAFFLVSNKPGSMPVLVTKHFRRYIVGKVLQLMLDV